MASETSAKPPNWCELEVYICKKAQHEVSTSNGIIAGASLREKAANCYRRHARLVAGEEGTYPWVDRPWAAKGRGCLYTLEDSIAKRPEADLWKQAAKIDTQIRKTHMVAWNEFTLDNGEIPSGKTPDDGLEYCKNAEWEAKEKARIDRLKAKKEQKEQKAVAPAAPQVVAPAPAEAAPTHHVVPVEAITVSTDATEGVITVVPVDTAEVTQGTTGGLNGRRIGSLMQAAASYITSTFTRETDDAEADDAEEEDEEGAGLSMRPMPSTYNGGIYFLTFKLLGPAGEKLPAYCDAGVYDTQAPITRETQRSLGRASKKLKTGCHDPRRALRP